jgi:hypothetical protein
MLPTIIAGYRVHPEYSGRRDAKLASWLDRSRMAGRARVELRKTSPTVGN